MTENRRQQRVITDLPVMLTTVLDICEGRIIDLSETGAQIVGASFPTGSRFQIDWQEQTIYARVMWDEVDRMGVRFEFPITNGPLHNVLQHGLEPPPTRPYLNAGIARAGNPGGFGRRAA